MTMQRWISLGALALLASGLFGCEAHSRYRVLCFFFDGVPVPRGEVPCDGQSAAGVSGAAKTNVSTAEVARKYSQHGPYAAKMCEGCHQRQTNQLLLPANDLCLYCHVLSVMKRRVHGPVASGSCSICHDAHGSGNEYLLVSNSLDFCLYCHQRQDVMRNAVHQDIENTGCTTCHDAHASNNDFLLRETPDPTDDSSPWVNPRQKPPVKKFARTAKAGESSSDRKKSDPDRPKRKIANEQAPTLKPRPPKVKVERIAEKASRAVKHDAWGGLVSF